jgi:hypothetical protein
MVFYSYMLVMKPRPRAQTTDALRQVALNVYASGGVLRRMSNEGVIRPYRNFRDSAGKLNKYVRYVQLEVDLSDTEHKKMLKHFLDHPDIVYSKWWNSERPFALRTNANYFPLDAYTRREEETVWPPQVSKDVYDQLDMNWKTFSKNRWSNYLRS